MSSSDELLKRSTVLLTNIEPISTNHMYYSYGRIVKSKKTGKDVVTTYKVVTTGYSYYQNQVLEAMRTQSEAMSMIEEILNSYDYKSNYLVFDVVTFIPRSELFHKKQQGKYKKKDSSNYLKPSEDSFVSAVHEILPDIEYDDKDHRKAESEKLLTNDPYYSQYLVLSLYKLSEEDKELYEQC